MQMRKKRLRRRMPAIAVCLLSLLGPPPPDAQLVAPEKVNLATRVADWPRGDHAGALTNAWSDANSIPSGIARGCILEGTPRPRQLIFPNGFTPVHVSDGGLSLPAPVLIIVRNLESGGTGLFIANFVPAEQE